MLGEILWESAELDRALAELEKVVGDRRRATCRRGARWRSSTRPRARPTIWRRSSSACTQLAPEDVEVKLDLGSAYQRMGDNVARHRRLRRDAQAAIRSNVQALKFVGDCYRRAKETDKAIAAYQKVHEARSRRSAALLPARRGLRGGGQRHQGRAGVPGRAAVQALPRRGVDQPGRDRVPARRSVEGDLVPVARGGAGADAAQGRTTTTRSCCRRRRSATRRSTS